MGIFGFGQIASKPAEYASNPDENPIPTPPNSQKLEGLGFRDQKNRSKAVRPTEAQLPRTSPSVLSTMHPQLAACLWLLKVV